MEALLSAIRQNNLTHLEASLAPLGANSDIDGLGGTPLHEAVRSGAAAAVGWLLAHGADFRARDAAGRTPLALALAGPRNLARLILDHAVASGALNAGCRERIWNFAGAAGPAPATSLPLLACLVQAGLAEARQASALLQVLFYTEEADRPRTEPEEQRLLRDFVARYHRLTVGDGDGPTPQALWAYLTQRQGEAPILAWLRTMAPLAGDSLALAPLLPRACGDILHQLFCLLTPFVPLEGLLSLIRARWPSVGLVYLLELIDQVVAAGRYDQRRWLLALVHALALQPEPLRHLLDHALSDKARLDLDAAGGHTLRSCAGPVLARYQGSIVQVFGSAEALVDALPLPVREAFAASDMVDCGDDAQAWFALARALYRYRLLPRSLPPPQAGQWPAIGRWMVANLEHKHALHMAKCIGRELAPNPYDGTRQPCYDVQTRLVRRCLDADPALPARLTRHHIAGLDDPALLEHLIGACGDNDEVRRCAIHNLGFHLEGFDLGRTLLRKYLDRYVAAWSNSGAGPRLPPPTLELLWSHRRTAHTGPLLALIFCGAFRGAVHFEQFRRCYLEDPVWHDVAFATVVDFPVEANLETALRAWEWVGPATRAALVSLTAQTIACGHAPPADAAARAVRRELLGRCVAADPVRTITLLGERASEGLRLIGDGVLAAVIPFIEKHAGRKGAADVAAGLARITPERLRYSGLLRHRTKAVRDAALRGLCASEAAGAQALLRRSLSEIPQVWDEVQYGHALDRIEALGGDVADLDPFARAGVAELERYAGLSTGGRRSAPVARLLGKTPVDLDLPFNATALDWALGLLAAEQWGRTPRYLRKLFGLCPREQQLRLCEHLVLRWLQAGAGPREQWITLLARDYGDDRLVAPLLEAAGNWRRGNTYQRAIRVVRTLALLGSDHALDGVDTIRRSADFQSEVRAAAEEALAEVAQRGGVWACT